jgi:UDP-N-acetylmuramoylalanine--D-glutamate ligase
MMTSSARPIRTIDDLRGRRALVLGFARSGIAAARFLVDAGADVTVYDRRAAAELADALSALEARPVRLALGVGQAEAEALVAEADLLVASPSISRRFPTTDAWLREALVAAEALGAELISEVELFLRLTQARVLAVTGTKGKTTTAALLDAMLEAGGLSHVLGGNIGQPLIERTGELTHEDWAVVELSELQLPTISRGADVAVYTNILADHLDRHGSVEAYRAVKWRLAMLTAQRGGRVVLNADDPVSAALGGQLGSATAAWYASQRGSEDVGHREPEAFIEGTWVTLRGERLLPIADLPLPGAHMWADLLAAVLGASLAGVEPAAIASAVRSFKGVPHRMETVAERAGVRYVNDSQATIPVAAIAALEAFAPARVVLIAGGQGKGLEYEAFAEAIVARCRAAIFMGETGAELERLVAGRVPVRRVGGMDEAVRAAAAVAHAGDVVVLSPAAASFDMFTDYAARGSAFRDAVAALSPAPRSEQP